MPEPTPEVALVLELVRAERFVEAMALVGNLPAGMAGDPDVVLVEAALLVHAGRIAAAAELCTRLVAADELNAGATYLLGLCLEAVGDTDHALSQYARAIHLDAAFAMPRLRRGMLARRANIANAAKDLAEAAVLLETEDSSRLLLFGGGFGRAALIGLCASESALAARGTR
jgi:chemotaxis protein methyltransferase CheR